MPAFEEIGVRNLISKPVCYVEVFSEKLKAVGLGFAFWVFIF